MSDVEKKARIIFVGGAPRSGTTLVQNILDTHPDIIGGPEFDRIPDIIELRNQLHKSIQLGRIDIYCKEADVDKAIHDFIEQLLLPLANENNCSLISEKTPPNILVFSELLEIFPTSKFLFVIRDPRAIIASRFQVAKRAKEKGKVIHVLLNSLFPAINYVKICLDSGMKALEKSPDRILPVLYENLVIDPEKETKKICEFLEIPWFNQMLKPSSKRHLGEKLLDGLCYDVKSYYRDPDPSQMFKWNTQLSPIQQIIISDSFKDNQFLLNLGYEFSLKHYRIDYKILGLVISTSNKVLKTISIAIIQRLQKIPCIVTLGLQLYNLLDRIRQRNL